MKKAIFLCLLAAASVAALSGCGGSGNSDGPPLTKAVFVMQGNAICRKAQAERNRLAKSVTAEVGDATGEEGAESLAEALLAPIKTMTSELKELVPMKGQVDSVEAILTAFEEGASEIEAEPASPRLAFAFEIADELSQRYGLTECRI